MARMKKEKRNGVEKPVDFVGNLADLDRLCRAEVAVEFSSGGTRWRIMARQLTPKEAGRVRELLVKAMPPLLPMKAGEEEARFDFTDPGYRAKKEVYERQARALAVYLGCEMYRQGKPGLESVEQIQEFVEGQGTDGLLQALYLRIAGGAVGTGSAEEEAGRVNFI